MAEMPHLERIERERARNANKEPVNVNEEIGVTLEELKVKQQKLQVIQAMRLI